MMQKTDPSEKAGANAVRANFPFRLHYLLSQASQLRIDDTLAWHPSGEKFIIYNQAKFVANILPNIFKQTKFASFRRQLNAYGFEREMNQKRSLNNPNSVLVYFHKDFKKDDPVGCGRIPRRRTNQILLEGLSRIGADESFMKALTAAKGENQLPKSTKDTSPLGINVPTQISSSSFTSSFVGSSNSMERPSKVIGNYETNQTRDTPTPVEVLSSKAQGLTPTIPSHLSKLNGIVTSQDARTKSRIASYLCQLANKTQGSEAKSMIQHMSTTTQKNVIDDETLSDTVLDELAETTIDSNMSDAEYGTADMILWDPRQECLSKLNTLSSRAA